MEFKTIKELEVETRELKIKELELQLKAKEQVISCLYNLLKDVIFWRAK